VKFLLLADLHLGSPLDAWRDQAEIARHELLRAWNEALDLVTSGDEGIDGMLLAGDLFHTPEPEASVLDSVSRGLERVVRSGKTVVAVPGIYDGLASPRSVYRRHAWPKGITVVDWCHPRVISIEISGETLHLVTFAPLPGDDPRPGFPDALPPSGFRAGLFHAVPRSESPLADWGPSLAPEYLGDLGLQLVVVGGDVRFREALWSGTVIVSPGALVPSRPGDMEESAWTLVTLASEGVNVERRLRTLALDPDCLGPAPRAAAAIQAHREGLRGAFLRVYENRKMEAGDRALLEAALRYGLEELERGEAPHVD
jgi:Calcineurin-like phosphoesterase